MVNIRGFGFRIALAAVLATAFLATFSDALVAQSARPATRPTQTWPGPVEAVKPFERWDRYAYEIGHDGLMSVTRTYRGRINLPAMLQPAGTFTIDVNDHFYTFALIEAFTLKPDGRKVAFDPAKLLFQRAPGAPEALHFHADVTQRTVVFPDLAVGDEVHITYRTTQKRMPLTGGQSVRLAFPRSTPRVNATVSLVVPKSVAVQMSSRLVTHAVADRGTFVRHEWSFGGQPQQSIPSGSPSVFDFEPMVSFSTLPDWNAVGSTFWKNAAPKAAITPDIASLAASVTAGLTSDRQRAEAIFQWVTSNIRYVNIVLGAGGWVPNQAREVLRNRFGDCKDQVTLTRALLSAVNIASEYTLINVAPIYSYSAIPLPHFDHVILFIPSLDLYADPTVSTSRLGELPFSAWGKPSLRIRPEGSIYGRVPVPGPAANGWIHSANIHIAPDGSATGTSHQTGLGSAAIYLRSRIQAFHREGAEVSATRLLRAQNWNGEATFQLEEASNAIQARFKFTGSFAQGSASEIRLPTGPRINNRPMMELLRAAQDRSAHSRICTPSSYRENLTMSWPQGFHLGQKPADVRVAAAGITYEARYRTVGRSLVVVRTFSFDPGTMVCTPQMLQSMLQSLTAVNADLNARFQLSRRNQRS